MPRRGERAAAIWSARLERRGARPAGASAMSRIGGARLTAPDRPADRAACSGSSARSRSAAWRWRRGGRGAAISAASASAVSPSFFSRSGSGFSPASSSAFSAVELIGELGEQRVGLRRGLAVGRRSGATEVDQVGQSRGVGGVGGRPASVVPSASADRCRRRAAGRPARRGSRAGCRPPPRAGAAPPPACGAARGGCGRIADGQMRRQVGLADGMIRGQTMQAAVPSR